VLGVPSMVRHDLLKKMLASIDMPVKHLVVIDNSRGQSLSIDGVDRSAFEEISVVKPGWNLGVSASWNRVITEVPESPWWMIVNDDIVFAEGDLERLRDFMDGGGSLGMLMTPSAFAISVDTIETVGTFDENFHPAYYEDNDYVYRCGLLGVAVTALPANYHHERSATINSNPALRSENHRTFPLNRDYYIRKWGGMPLQETFRTPFNQGGSPRDWELEPGRVQKLTWRWA
jgi:GT2 family glycosyltransferase